MKSVVQNTKEIPESIYFIASLGKQAVNFNCPSCKALVGGHIDIPLSGHFCKAFTMEEAVQKMVKKFPNPNITFRVLNHCTVLDFMNGCEIEVAESVLEKPKEKRKTRAAYFKELIDEMRKASAYVCDENEKAVLEKVIKSFNDLTSAPVEPPSVASA